MKDRFYLWDMPIDNITYEEALNKFKTMISQDGLDLIVTPNSEILLMATGNEELKKIIQSASLVIPDGTGILYASRILKNPLKERVTGIDFLNMIFSYLNENKLSCYLLGGQKGVSERASLNIKKVYPDIEIKGTHNGYFNMDEADEIIKDINESNALFLCVAMGSPRQELFVKKYEKEFDKVRCAMGVGGSLDVWAGDIKRAPLFFQKYGLEWFYRVIKEPKRFSRILRLPAFMAKVIRTKIN
ncbi:MAG: WecB/TagA/CpsF family glycosyltransferase [Anaerovoracaceae bacterium]|nr:WecB/TagA/CpsF family glycosyltransferase [Clostridiales bacterium]